jgi:hypothetical protein
MVFTPEFALLALASAMAGAYIALWLNDSRQKRRAGVS